MTIALRHSCRYCRTKLSEVTPSLSTELPNECEIKFSFKDSNSLQRNSETNQHFFDVEDRLIGCIVNTGGQLNAF
jgi:hypothetical protein